MDVTEQEQLDAFKQWWEKNGKIVIVLAIAVLVAFLGGKTWRDYNAGQSENASVQFEMMLAAMEQGDSSSAIDIGGRLIGQFASTPYSSLASLALAKLHVEKGDAETARTHLQWAMDSAKQDEVKMVARLRLARLLVSENLLDEAMNLLSTVEAGPFTAPFEEVKGDIYLAKGDKEQARSAYNKALNMSATATVDSNNLRMKLDDLGAK